MPELRSPIVSFAAGELSPLLARRVDLQLFASGCRALENFLVRPQGAATRRPGTRHVARLGGADLAVRLVPFTFTAQDAAVIVLTATPGAPGQARIYREGGLVLGAGGAPLTLETPYQPDDLARLQWAQVGDIVVFADGTHAPQELRRTEADWSWAAKTYQTLPHAAGIDPPIDAWSDARGWPIAVTLHDDRLVFGGSRSEPQTLWLSETGVFDVFRRTAPDSEPIVDSDPVVLTIAGRRRDEIVWLSALQDLIVGSTNGVVAVYGAGRAQPITPSSAQRRRQAPHPCSAVPPVEVDAQLLMVEAPGTRLRALGYSFQEDRVIAPDLTLTAEHLGARGIVDLAAVATPDPIVWCALADGGLAALTYEPAQQVRGWAQASLGGGGLARAVAGAPTGDLAGDELLIAVARGAYLDLEALPPRGRDAPMLDAHLAAQFDAPVAELSGLDHLNGLAALIAADGAAAGGGVVAEGRLRLSRPARAVVVGLAVPSRLVPNLPAVNLASGPSHARRRALGQPWLHLVDSRGGSVRFAPDEAGLPIPYPPAPLGAPPPLTTASIELTAGGDWDLDPWFEIIADGVDPMTVAGITLAVQVPA